MKMFFSACLMLLTSYLYAEDVVTISVAPGETSFTVSLASNPSTGYDWTVTRFDSKLLKLVTSKYTPDKTNMVGSGGTMAFNFELVSGAAKPQSTTMEFRYARSWEKDGGTLQNVVVIFAGK